MSLSATASLPDRFTDLMERLMSDVAAEAPKGWVAMPLIKLLWRRFRNLKNRFAAILARFHAGTLPKVGTLPKAGTLPAPGSTPRRPAPPRPAAVSDAPPPLVLPQRKGWVLETICGTMIPGYELEKMVADPELEALVAEAPQLGRVLRPLCRMLAVKLPAWLRLPRRPRPKRPKRHRTMLRLGAGEQWRRPSPLWPTHEEALKYDAKTWVWDDEW